MLSMDYSKIIDNFGGTGKLAEICGLEKSAISQWRKRGIPHSWVMYLKKLKPKNFSESRK
jgi:hypothetical protein